MNTSLCLLDEKECASLLGISVQTLRNNRMNGKGIRFIRIGRLCRYRLQDINQFLEENTISPRA